MKSPFSLINVMGFLLINILVSAFTTWVVVRTLVPPLAQAAPLVAPTATTTNTPSTPTAESSAATPDAPAIPQANPPAPAAAQATPTLLSAGTTTTVNVRISSVIYAGQLSREVVVIVNEGDKVDMTGWTLVPPRGAPYAFKQVVMFKNSFVNLHTTTGTDVPNDLYWGLGEPMWQSGDELKLLRTDGSTAATFKVK